MSKRAQLFIKQFSCWILLLFPTKIIQANIVISLFSNTK